MLSRRLVVGFVLASFSVRLSSAMESVRVSADGKGFVQRASGKPFMPWGMNYSSNDLEERWDKDWPAIERDLAELKRLGANVLRIHLQFDKFMAGPHTLRRHPPPPAGRPPQQQGEKTNYHRTRRHPALPPPS